MSGIEQRCGLYIPPDENITTFSTGHHVQRVTVNNRFLMVESPWLGDFVIQDPLMYDFYTTPNALRSGSVSQLCKSQESSTIPNLSDFTRKWGLLEIHELAEIFGRQQNLSREELTAVHIAVEGPDLAHTAWSHALEQFIQKWGGPENHHELVWPVIAQLGGTTDVLQKHGVPYDENMRVPGIRIPPWADGVRPDIDLDNFQYIAAEALLWFDHDQADPKVRTKVREAINPKNIIITPEGRMAFSSAEHALVVGKLLLLFASEHWNEPINRVQLFSQIHVAQRAILLRRLAWMDEIDKGETRQPAPYLHAIDQDFVDSMKTGPGRADDFMYLMGNTINAIGMEDRRRFVDYRLAEYTKFILDDQATTFPSEYLEPKRVEFGPRSSSVDTAVVELTEEDRNRLGESKLPVLDDDPNTVSFMAGPLKNRYIDPLVQVGTTFQRLSQARSSYKKLLKEQQYLQTLGIKVRFAFTEEYTRAFREGIYVNDREFSGVTRRTQMTGDQYRRIIEAGAKRATDLGQKLGTLILKRELVI